MSKQQVFYSRSEFNAAKDAAVAQGVYVKHSERRVMTRGSNRKAPRYMFTLDTTDDA